MKVFLSIFLFIPLLSCQEEASTFYSPAQCQTVEHTTLLKMTGYIEYTIHTSHHSEAAAHIAQLITCLEDKYSNASNTSISTQLHTIINECKELKQAIYHRDTDNLLCMLSSIKSGIYNLQPTTTHDEAILVQLWRVGDHLSSATTIGMDPMLDLYEWGEYTLMVHTLYEEWTQYISDIETLQPEGYKNQHLTYNKKELDKLKVAFGEFTVAFQSEEYERYAICEYAEALRQAYVDYLQSLLSTPQNHLL